MFKSSPKSLTPFARFFLLPQNSTHRQYEALRAYFVDRLPSAEAAARFGYSPGYIRLLRHQFRHGKIDFSEPVPEGKTARRRVSSMTTSKE